MDAETSAYYTVFLNMVCQATQTAANSQDSSKPPYLAPLCSSGIQHRKASRAIKCFSLSQEFSLQSCTDKSVPISLLLLSSSLTFFVAVRIHILTQTFSRAQLTVVVSLICTEQAVLGPAPPHPQHCCQLSFVIDTALVLLRGQRYILLQNCFVNISSTTAPLCSSQEPGLCSSWNRVNTKGSITC